MREGYEKKNCETSWKYLEWSLIRTRSSRPIGPLLLFEVSLHLAGRDHTCLAPIINVIKRILINLVSWHFYLYSLTLANLKICDPILFFIQSQIFTISDHSWNETKYDLIVKFRFSSPNNPSSYFFSSSLPSMFPNTKIKKLSRTKPTSESPLARSIHRRNARKRNNALSLPSLLPLRPEEIVHLTMVGHQHSGHAGT